MGAAIERRRAARDTGEVKGLAAEAAIVGQVFSCSTPLPTTHFSSHPILWERDG